MRVDVSANSRGFIQPSQACFEDFFRKYGDKSLEILLNAVACGISNIFFVSLPCHISTFCFKGFGRDMGVW